MRNEVLRRVLKALAWLLAVLLLAPVIAFAAYDLIEFQPHRAEIQRLIDEAAPAEKSPPAVLRQVVHAAHPDATSSLSGSAVRLLRVRLDFASDTRTLHRQMKETLWWALVTLHCSEQEQSTLYLSLSYMGNDTYGFSKAAPALVGVPLADVSLEQAARLVAVTRAPSSYLRNPERWARASEVLLARAKALPPQ